ncbi:MAG: precorrin-6A reductase [Acidaminobacteraceae bacterium]
MILVMAGTSDGRIIAKEISLKHDVLTTATTPYGKKLLEDMGAQVLMDKMDSNYLLNLIEKMKIKAIIDATHPYAENGTRNAIDASEKAGIIYIRYERPRSELITEDQMYDYEGCIEKLKNSSGNILLTVGSNNLDLFLDESIINRVYPRVLPTSMVIKKCEKLGFDTGKIIAMRGPFSQEMNSLMMKEFDIKFIITKESSDVGGFKEKVLAAKENNVEVIVIKRPNINMKNVMYNYEDVYETLEAKLLK